MKIKRILAIIGVVLLVLMYLSTLFFAIFEDPNTYRWFRASIAATIVIPIIIFSYQYIYKILSKWNQTNQQTSNGISNQSIEEQNSDEAP